MRSANRLSILLLVAAAALLSGSCRWVRELMGAPGGETPAQTRSDGGAAVTFAVVAPILRRACTQPCHDGQALAADDFVFLDSGDLRERLLGAAPPTVPPPCQNRPLVEPGNPESSLLVAMIEEPDGPRAACAERMPHSCPDQRPCLSDEDVQTIRRWIQAGAAP